MATMDQRYFEHGLTRPAVGEQALITVRLAHSIPFSAREKLLTYRLRRDADGNTSQDAQRMAELFAYWDLTLDLSPGPRWLEHPDVAAYARRALRDMDGVLCRVRSWVLLPTHIHVLAQRHHDHMAAPGMLHVADALKTPVAYRVRRTLRVFSPVWEDDVHIHTLDGGGDIERTLRYLRQEPVRAGLVATPDEWEWKGEKGY
jgi:putative transposase